MSSFWSTLSRAEGESQSQIIGKSRVSRSPLRCEDFLQFLAIAFNGGHSQHIGLHPVLINSSPTFSDINMGGVSFDIRKARASSFPYGLDDATFVDREFVVVKQPRLDQTRQISQPALDEIAAELQILRHPSIKQHANLLDLLRIVYYNTVDDNDKPYILPAIVVGCAELGDLRSYMAVGYGRSIQDKFEICQDIARGLDQLHHCGIVHCDIKDTNMLVCTDKQKKLVVKISDFGFAISTEDEEPRLIGYTPFWEAPEVHQPLCRSLLPQLDIYSYGILTFTVLRNGALYYDLHEISRQPEQIMKMKVTDLLPILFQMNILNYLKDERCMLLIFCKIIVYALRADPKQRFASMENILQLLKKCDPSDLDEELHVGESLYTYFRFRTTYYAETRSQLINDFMKLSQEYETAQGLDSPLNNALMEFRYKRYLAEIQMFMSKPGPSDVDWYRCCPGMTFMLTRSTLGVLPEKETAGNRSTVKRNGNTEVISFSQERTLNLTEHHNVLQKLHSTVKKFIFSELEATLEASSSDAQNAHAMYNLAYCYIDGLGVEPDLSKGIELLHCAAKLGSPKARKQVLEISTARWRLEDLDQESFLNWGAEIIDETDRKCLSVLHNHDLHAYRHKRQAWSINRMLNMEFMAHTANGTVTSESDICASSSWRKKMAHFASATDLVMVLQDMLGQNATILETLNSYGQTPMIVAFQSGSFEVAKYLLQQGADLTAQDLDGISALHWLVSFPDSEKAEIASYLYAGVSNTDAFARIPQQRAQALNTEGAPNATGTPLHWAVACRDVLAVDMLMSMGYNASRRPDANTLSPFEQACSLRAAEIVERMLQDPSVRATATRHHPFRPEFSVTINAMFHVLKDVSRSQLLAQLGLSFEETIAATIGHLVNAGTSIDSVLYAGAGTSHPMPMSATFATAFHQCPVEIMRAGFQHGFCQHLNTTFGGASSNGPAMSLAIAHKDRQMFGALLGAGASISWRNMYRQSALTLAAKETDDPWFVERLLDMGALVDDPTEPMSGFYVATYSGNLSIATLLWERGAKRETKDRNGMTILGRLIGMRTRNSTRCIRFVLGLRDREESDGFLVWRGKDDFDRSAFHVALVATEQADSLSEDPEKMETSRLLFSILLEKYHSQQQVDSKIGTHRDTPLGAAVEIGNHYVVRLLLEAGAEPNAEDEYSRTPLDKLYWRYCYPATIEYLQNAPLDDKIELAKRLRHVNENTSEIMSLLLSHGAHANVFRFPAWHESSPGYRDVEWVSARLRERREAPPQTPSEVPSWSGLPITIPERPYQFESQRRLAARRAADEARGNNQSTQD